MIGPGDPIADRPNGGRCVVARPDADWLAGFARRLAAEDGLEELFEHVVEASVGRIDGAEQAGVTILAGRSATTPVATDPLVHDIDRLQYLTGEGPCLSAALDHQPVVRVEDLSRDRRWPEFSAAVADLGVRSMLSLQLYTDAETIGALNLYATAPDAFHDESVRAGTLLAAHAAVAAVGIARSGNLRIALVSRDVIGQAKGILMERYKVTPDQAFDLLIAASQQAHRKLRDVAAELTATGEFALDAVRSG